ncbi:MAG: DUF5615 family PIN-like protein [Patescibacteria group bacterium]
MLKFIIDHNVPKSVGIFLQKAKYNVKFVRYINPEMSDLQIINFAAEEKRIIISNDKDFRYFSVKYRNVDMILFSYISQQADVRIDGLKQVLPELKVPFGAIILR